MKAQVVYYTLTIINNAFARNNTSAGKTSQASIPYNLVFKRMRLLRKQQEMCA